MGKTARVNKLSKEALRQTLARNIRHARNLSEPKLTQEGAAQLFSPPLSRAAVAQWEAGEALPDIDRLAVLSQAFGVTIDSLIFGDDYAGTAGRELSPEALKLARSYMKIVDKRQRELILSLVQTIEK